MTATPPGVPRSGQTVARLLTWGVAVFDLLIVALAAGTLIWSRGQYVERAEVSTHNLAQVLEQNIGRRSKSDAARVGDIAKNVRDAISHTRSLARGLSPAMEEFMDGARRVRAVR